MALARFAAPALEIVSVSLVSCSAVTHHYDWDQRFLDLSFAVSGTDPNTRLVLSPPANGYVAPPGWYMLFINARDATVGKIPSIAMFVRLS